MYSNICISYLHSDIVICFCFLEYRGLSWLQAWQVFKRIRASIVNLHEFMCLNPQTARLYFSFGVYNFIYQFHHFCSKIFLYNNPFHVWEALKMTKNNVFGSTSGRGISKTKALFGCLSQAYLQWWKKCSH